MKSISPGKKVWQRFCRNKLSLFGMIVILCGVFVSIFCYLFIPDNTPLSNRMNLALGNLPPGFTVQMLSFAKKPAGEKTTFISGIFFGRKDNFVYVPVSSFRFEKDEIYYSEYGGPGSRALPEQKIKLADAIYGAGSTDTEGLTGIPDTQPPDIQSGKTSLALLQREFISNHVDKRSFILGTDRYGRDLFSRLMAGTRVTFGVGLIAVFISLLVGTFLGSLAGFFRGKVDQFVLWLINVIWSVPTLLLVIAITLVLGKGFEQVFIAVGLTMWVDVARIVRNQLFSVRELEFVAAGKALGFNSSRIVIRHMLPNIMGPVLVVAAANFSTAILLEAGLSFLGIGAQPPTPSWGSMIKENYGYIIIPGSAHLAIFPGLAIMMLTMAFTFVANGLRDALDSRQQLSITG